MSVSARALFVARAKSFARELWVYLLLALVLTTIIATTTQRADALGLSALFVGNLVLSLSIGASCELAVLALKLLPFAGASLRARVLVGVPAVGASVLAGAELGLFVLRRVLPASWQFSHSAVLLITAPVTLVMVGVALLRDRARHEQAQRREIEVELEAVRLRALSSRTEPHFLFNALNGIAALIAEDAQRAERAVLSLAAMFRYVLEGSNAAEVSLRDELAFVRAYLSLEQLRYAERLCPMLDVAPGLDDFKLPPLLIQPLVENAVRHGLSTQPTCLHVALRVERHDEAIVISVDDDGPGPERSQHRGSRTSQAELRQRLTLAYGEAAQFETGASALGGFRAMLRIPRGAHAGIDRRR